MSNMGRPRKFDERDFRSAFARISAIYGRTPSLREWERQRLPWEPAGITARSRFGSWSRFVAEMSASVLADPNSQLELRSSRASARRAKNEVPT